MVSFIVFLRFLVGENLHLAHLRGPGAKLLLVRADDLALALVEQDAANRSAQPFERNRLALAQHRINLEIIVRMAVAHLLHGSSRQHRIIALRTQRREVAQELREINPLVAEIVHREIVLLTDIPEILLLRLRPGPHQRLELRGLPVPLAETDDAPLDDRAVEFEIGLVSVVIGRDLVGGQNILPILGVLGLADQQRLAVLLQHLVDVARRRGKERLRLLELELLEHPAVDVNLHKGRAVVARKPLRDHRPHVAQPQVLAAGPRNGRVAGKITRQLPASRQQQHTRRDRYFRSQIHIPKGKDTFFTCK